MLCLFTLSLPFTLSLSPSFLLFACREREFGPRFATPGSAEFDMAARWCAVYDNEKMRQTELDGQLKDARSQLMQEMDQFNRHDFMQEHTMQLRARE